MIWKTPVYPATAIRWPVSPQEHCTRNDSNAANLARNTTSPKNLLWNLGANPATTKNTFQNGYV
eukprot:9127995-Lingulodinium_polyedra.AAC.1